MENSPVLVVLNLAASAALLIWAVRLVRTGFERAVELALSRLRRGDVPTHWANAELRGAPSDPLPSDPDWAFQQNPESIPVPQLADSSQALQPLDHFLLAKLEANAAGADDALMLDTDGNLAETNATHVFLVNDGVVETLNVEAPMKFEVSDADSILSAL